MYVYFSCEAHSYARIHIIVAKQLSSGTAPRSKVAKSRSTCNFPKELCKMRRE